MRQRRGANSGLTPYSQLRFRSDLQQSLIPQVSKGVATPTFTRATTASVPDFEGIVRTALSGEPRFKGARRVENVITAATDFTSGWSTSAGGTGTAPTLTANYGADPNGNTTAARLQLDRGASDTGSDLSRLTTTTSIAPWTNSVWAKSTDGSSTYEVGLTSAATPVTVTGSWQRFGTAFGVGTTFQPGLYGGQSQSQTADILIWHPLAEFTEGQANQNPSEYVSSGVLSAPYHGANVDAVQYFNTLNGNTVASNVVTEATGSLIGASNEYADAKGSFGLMSEAAATNICLQSEDLGTTWTPVDADTSVTVNAVSAPDGATTADKIIEATTNSSGKFYQQTMTLTAATYTLSFYAKAAERTWIGVQVNRGLNEVRAFDLGSGAVGSQISGSNTATIESLPDGWFRCSMTFTGDAGVWNYRLWLSTGDNINAYVGVVNSGAYFWGAQLEVGSFPTAYIPTTTTSVTRNAGIESYPVTGNLAANNGTVRIDWTPDQLLMGTVFIWATYVDASNYTAILHDGTNVVFRKRISGTNNDATKALTYVAGTTYTLVGTYSDSVDSEIYVDGVQGTGHANNVDIQIGSSQQVGADGNGANQSYSSQRLLKIFDVTKSAAEVALL